MNKQLIIIGTGLAGYNTARAVRKQSPDINITILSHDGGAFYSKPQLSVALSHKKTAQDLMAMSAEKMATSINATVITQQEVVEIDPINNHIHTAENSFSYDDLVLAIGADALSPYLEGTSAHEVLSINSVYDYSEFRERITNKKHITIIGAGLIGCEFANDLVQAGFSVDIIDPAATALSQLVPSEVGAALQSALTHHGVHWHMGHVAKTIDKINDQYCVTLSNGEQINTDCVISAIGLRAKTALADGAGIKINRGIIVDQYCRSSVHNIYALGDCAKVNGFHLPYVAPILHCSNAIAKTLTGEQTAIAYPAMPVIIKTSLYPICVCTPVDNSIGSWQIQHEGNSIRALFMNDGALKGFVLSNQLVCERMALAKQITNWM